MVKLQRGKVLPLRQGAGKTLTTHAGAVWVTEEGSGVDVVLNAGESFTLGQHGLALVEAFSDAAISLEP